MCLLRVVPLFPFVLGILVPAFLGVRTRTYVLATFFGIMPGTVVYASVGNGLGAVFDAGGEVDLSGVLTRPEVWGPMVALVLLAMLPIAYKKLKARKAAV